jgi:hypothetical protein
MFDQIELGREFFEGLMAIDAAILARAGREVCRFCGGPLRESRRPDGTRYIQTSHVEGA